jgi:Plasmid pRiA4b ORF-3-like protein
MPLCCVHEALQVVMGWSDSHMHRFEKKGVCWGVPDDDEFNELDLIDERKTLLAQVLNSKGDSMIYLYNFGEDWRHQVTLEKITPMSNGVKTPVCLAGKRRCPPDGVGGVSGYEEFLKFIVDPAHRNYEPFIHWAGGLFRAEEFNLTTTNIILSRMPLPTRHRR